MSAMKEYAIKLSEALGWGGEFNDQVAIAYGAICYSGIGDLDKAIEFIEIIMSHSNSDRSLRNLSDLKDIEIVYKERALCVDAVCPLCKHYVGLPLTPDGEHKFKAPGENENYVFVMCTARGIHDRYHADRQ